MLTLLFIFLKLFNFIHISWWWILLPIILDEEMARKTQTENVFEDVYSNLEDKYPNNEEEIRDILEEYGYDIDEDEIREELRSRI